MSEVGFVLVVSICYLLALLIQERKYNELLDDHQRALRRNADLADEVLRLRRNHD